MKELELYIHIPFCVQKCLYCDFLSAPAAEETKVHYLLQLQNEIAACKDVYQEYEVTTIFIGGGTPSLLSGGQIEVLTETVRKSFFVRTDAEITMECNPATLTQDKLDVCKKAGINRLSIGLQSADDAELKLLGRIHTFEQFLETYDLVRKTGFTNVNIDIISALPKQKPETYEKTLRTVLDLEPEHISAYSLIIEEGTPFYTCFQEAEKQREKGLEQSCLPSEEEERLMYEMTGELLKAAGFVRYEISNYAREGFYCKHNIGYWTRKNYLGVGLGAASLIENIRFSNTSDLQTYLQMEFASYAGKVPDMERYENIEHLTICGQMEEFMFLGLRMTQGISADVFFGQFGKTLGQVYGNVLQKLSKQGLLVQTQDGCRLTEMGIAVSNYALANFLL